jgi:hypothetical protein
MQNNLKESQQTHENKYQTKMDLDQLEDTVESLVAEQVRR